MATSPVQRERLAMCGFYRVDGLTCHQPDGQSLVIMPRDGEICCWDENHGTIVMITVDGEMWLGDSYYRNQRRREEINRLIAKISPRRGAFVPCTNGEVIYQKEIQQRLADPDWMPR